MPRQHVAQDREMEPQDGARSFDVADRPFQFEVIPQVCLVREVCHFLRLSERQFHYLMARRELAIVELEPLDRVRRFSGESVAFEIRRRCRKRVA